MPPPGRLALAVAGEIRAEMARQKVTARELARRIHTADAAASGEGVQAGRLTYLLDRLNEKRTFDLNDISAVSDALGIGPKELVGRAVAAVGGDIEIEEGFAIEDLGDDDPPAIADAVVLPAASDER